MESTSTEFEHPIRPKRKMKRYRTKSGIRKKTVGNYSEEERNLKRRSNKRVRPLKNTTIDDVTKRETYLKTNDDGCPRKQFKVGSRQNSRVNQKDSLQDGISGQLLGRVDAKFYLYGHNETQVSEGGEADLHKHLVGCKKNPGHTKFTPVKTFRMEDLPQGYHDIDLYELIKATADLTVRVEVKMTSPHRPEFYPDTNVPYPVYNMRNKTTLRLGTGQIYVLKFIDARGVDAAGDEYNVATGKKYLSFFDESTRTCPCTKCQHSDKPNNVWWEIIVYTATHVVFDDIEASHTSCALFYDEQDSPVVSLDKVSVDYVNIERDKCMLKYVTCDSLGDKLYNMAVHRSDLWWKVWNKYRNKSDVKLTFIVSHPHGCHKQVSVGHLMDNHKVSEYNKNIENTKLTYTTATCPGSSGARVYCVGSYNGHYHSGALDSGLNYSCVGIYRK